MLIKRDTAYIYTQGQLDSSIADAIAKALEEANRERDENFVSKAVAQALVEQNAQKRVALEEAAAAINRLNNEVVDVTREVLQLRNDLARAYKDLAFESDLRDKAAFSFSSQLDELVAMLGRKRRKRFKHHPAVAARSGKARVL